MADDHENADRTRQLIVIIRKYKECLTDYPRLYLINTARFKTMYDISDRIEQRLPNFGKTSSRSRGIKEVTTMRYAMVGILLFCKSLSCSQRSAPDLQISRLTIKHFHTTWKVHAPRRKTLRNQALIPL